MVALRKLTCLLSILWSALALGSGTAAHGQGANGASSFSEVRIHPDSILYQPQRSDGTIVPPRPIIKTVPPITPSVNSAREEGKPEVLPDPQSSESMVEAVGVCVKVLKTGFELDLSQLIENSWGYTRPVKTKNALGTYEKVDYIKDNLTISLQDFGDKILCRVVGMIADQKQFSDIRKALSETLGATPISETSGYELAAKFMAERQPNGSINNAYILGEHVIEIATVEQDFSKSGIVGAGTETIALLTSSPTASNFRKLNETIRNQ